MGGQHYTPADLPPGKTQYPLYRKLGGPQGWYGMVWKMSHPPVMAFTENTNTTEESKIYGCSTQGYHSKFSAKETYLRREPSNTGIRP